MAQQPTFIVDLLIHTGTDFTQTFVLEDTYSNAAKDLTENSRAITHSQLYEPSSPKTKRD